MADRHGCVLVQSGGSQVRQEFFKRAKNLMDDMNKSTQAPCTLKEYSVWMSSFQASHYDEQLEIPGSC